jgi:acylphosphatase
MATLSVVVQGRVQGVGFRAYVARAAAQLGVKGEVWNRRDGAVEAILQHPDARVLDDLVARLQRGPGYVDHVWSDPVESTHEWTDFDIGGTR